MLLVYLERDRRVERRHVAAAAKVGAEQRGQHRQIRKVHDAAIGIEGVGGRAAVAAKDQLRKVAEELLRITPMPRISEMKSNPAGSNSEEAMGRRVLSFGLRRFLSL